MKKIILWSIVVIALAAAFVAMTEHDRDKCLNEVSKDFGRDTVYYHGQCIVDGYGKVRI